MMVVPTPEDSQQTETDMSVPIKQLSLRQDDNGSVDQLSSSDRGETDSSSSDQSYSAELADVLEAAAAVLGDPEEEEEDNYGGDLPDPHLSYDQVKI